MPLLGMLFAPFTWVFGAIATYNLLMQLSLGISAWAAYFVARRLHFSQFAACITGFLYGFSSYFISQGHAHLFLTFAPVPPIALWLLWRIVSQQGSLRRLGFTLGLLEAVDLLISAERVVMTIVVAAMALLIAYFFVDTDTRRMAIDGLRGAAVPLAVTALALGAVPVLISFFGPWAVRGNPHEWTALHHGELMEFVRPNIWYRPVLGWSRMKSDPLLGASLERSYYIGMPLVAVGLVGVWKFRARVISRIAVVLFTLLALLSLGNRFWINGHNTHIPTPFAWVAHVPILSSVIPNRFMLFASLLLAFGIGALVNSWQNSIGGTSRRSVRSRSVAALVVIGTIYCVTPAARFAVTPSSMSEWFHSAEFRDTVAPGSNVLIYPYPNPFFNYGMLVQADTGMRFKIVGGQAIVGDGQGHNQGITMEKPWQVSTVFMRTLWGATDGPNVAGLPGLNHQMPPRGSQSIAAFRKFVKRYKINTIIATPFGVDNALAMAYLTDAFGEPQVRNAGEIRFWKLPSTP